MLIETPTRLGPVATFAMYPVCRRPHRRLSIAWRAGCIAAAVLATTVGALMFAPTALATVTISSTGLHGTTTIAAMDDSPVDIAVNLYTDGDFTPPSAANLTWKCSPNEPESPDQCDQISSLGDGSEILAGVGGGCFKQQGSPHGPIVICPDVSHFAATLGGGNDELSLGTDGKLEYATATVDGGAGNDLLVGASPLKQTFPDADTFSGGAGDDTIKGLEGADVLSGGPGTDTVEGGLGNDTIHGDDGPDNLYGGAGNDAVDGGAGDDHFAGTQDADAGSDTFIGGPGQDSIDYFGNGQGVNVSLDGVANDGQAGEGDNVMPDIEVVNGSVYADTLSAGAAGVTLNGFGGNDVLIGGPGNDAMIGGGGDDAETGGGGADSFFGDDQGCSAASYGGCNAGNDTINAVDGIADQINCGPGADVANVDSLDVIATDPFNACETVHAPPKPPPPLLTIDSIAFVPTWLHGHGSGSIQLSGNATVAASAVVLVVGGGAKTPATLRFTFSVPAGAFRKTLPISERPIIPGDYRVSSIVAIPANAATTSASVASATLQGPAEGYVDAAWVTPFRGGPHTLQVYARKHSAFFAYFHLASPPRGLRIHLAIYAGGRLFATIARPTTTTVWVRQPIPPTLGHRTWRVVLFAGKIPVKKVVVRIT